MTATSTTAPEPEAPRANAAAPAVRAIGLTVRFDRHREALAGVDLLVVRGESAAILGANGAGKSTLLRAVAGLLSLAAGRLEVFGVGRRFARIAATGARIGYIAHQSMLYRDLTVRRNLEFFARLHAVPQPRGSASELIDLLGLGGCADDPVRCLSRGLVQRTAIARALVHDPDLILADEPFTGLDRAWTQRVEKLFRERSARGGTLLFAHHDPAQALSLGQRVVVLRAGRVVLDAASGDIHPGAVETLLEAGA